MYEYEIIPGTLRTQISGYIWQEVFGGGWHFEEQPEVDEYEEEKAYIAIENTFCREMGESSFESNSVVWSLCEQYRRNNSMDPGPKERLRLFFHYAGKAEEILDIIEISFRYMEDTFSLNNPKAREKIDDAIAELNYRFLFHDIGYQYEHGQIIRIGHSLLHSECVLPALRLLRSSSMYRLVNEYFLEAHKYYRRGEYTSCLLNCRKAFENCLKAICDQAGWEPKGDKIQLLIKKVFEEGLIDKKRQSYFEHLGGMLETDIPSSLQ